MGNFNEYGICKKCHKVIVLRKPGSSFWKLTGMKASEDKEKHEPLIIVSGIMSAMRIRKRSNEIYWKYTEKEQSDYYKAREKSIEEASKELGFTNAR